MIRECLSHLCGTTSHNGTDIDMVSFWTFCLVLATLLLYMVARYQLSGIKKTSNADFIKQYNNDFFVESTRNIIMLLDYKALIYHEKSVKLGANESSKLFQYFIIDNDILKQLELSNDIHDLLITKRVYSCFEIDDLLLGKLEDIGLFLKQGFLHKKHVVNHFAWYIDVAWNNPEIQKYIQAQRMLYGEMIYSHFEYAYKVCSKDYIVSTLWINFKQRIGGLCE